MRHRESSRVFTSLQQYREFQLCPGNYFHLDGVSSAASQLFSRPPLTCFLSVQQYIVIIAASIPCCRAFFTKTDRTTVGNSNEPGAYSRGRITLKPRKAKHPPTRQIRPQASRTLIGDSDDEPLNMGMIHLSDVSTGIPHFPR